MPLKLPVYLDNHATTRMDPRVLEAMLPWFSEEYGNASSRQHAYGWRAEAAVQEGRAQVAELVGAAPEEIVFTSGATESINLALKGGAEALASKGKHVITSATEHRAVLDCCTTLERWGMTVTVLPVDCLGVVDPESVRSAITDRTILVSIMTANNEIGTIADVATIGAICRSRGVLFHTDAAQAAGKIPLNARAIGADLMSFSAHKMYGPKGIGALYIRSGLPRVRIEPQMDGGGHERGMRSGTLNVPAIAGFGAAARIALREMEHDAAATGAMRDRLVAEVTARLDGVRLNGHPRRRLPNNANLTFSGIRADALMMDMKDLAVSSGSACSSASPEPSHVLRAIGLPDEEVLASLRFGLGRFTTDEEVSYASARLVAAVTESRARMGQYAQVS